jgi:uncharacterized glyoxalase superfamily protein PhnB
VVGGRSPSVVAGAQTVCGGALEGWSQDGRTGGRLREVPFPGLPLILNLGAPWQIETPSGGDVESHDSFVAGLHTAPVLVAGAPAASCIELRLTPLGAHRLLGLPMHELTNRTVPLEEVLPEARVLSERLRETASWSQRFELVETLLANGLVDSPQPAPGVAWSWQRLVQSGGQASIRGLADEVGWSSRRGSYDDPRAAIEFLIDTFGAERHAVYEGDDGTIRHAELRFGNGIVMLGSSSPEFPATRGSGGSLYVAVGDADAHHARAQSAGAEIILELHDTDYGSREYGARDPEGNAWYFGTYQPFAVTHPAEQAVSA